MNPEPVVGRAYIRRFIRTKERAVHTSARSSLCSVVTPAAAGIALTTFASFVADAFRLVAVVFVEPLEALSEGKRGDIRFIADADTESPAPHAGRSILFADALSACFENATFELSRVGSFQTRVQGVVTSYIACGCE